MWISRRRLDDDVTRWRRLGWVTSEGEAHIRDEISEHGHGLNLAAVFAILASVLFSFAIISFVAAHWNEIGRMPRLALLFGLIISGYALAGIFEGRGQRAFSDAAILFALAAFGASIALVSQMFHIDGHPPDGVFLWLLGAVLAGIVLRSNPALALSMVLLAVWSGMRSSEIRGVHWPFLIGWAVITAAFVWQRWRPGVHISGVALSGFVITLGYLLNDGHAHQIVAGIGLVATFAAIAGRHSASDFEPIAAPALGYAIAVTFAGLYAMQFIDMVDRGSLVLVAGLTLAGLLAAIWYGLGYAHRGALWLGYVGFSVEILALYWETVGSILSTSLFFLMAALIVAALAALAWWIAGHRSKEGAPA